MRILVVYPLFTRYSRLGAEEQDSLACLEDFHALGHQVCLLVMNNNFASMDEGRAFFGQFPVQVQLVPYEKRTWHWRRAGDLAFLDGAAWEHGQPHFIQMVRQTAEAFQADFVWSRASFTWPVLKALRSFGLPSVLRSVNFEPHHEFLHEGRWLPNQLRLAGKWLGEIHCLYHAGALAAITPYEAGLYEQLKGRVGGRAAVDYVPLQSLHKLLRPPQPARQARPLRVFFMAASLLVSHNGAALAMIAEQIVPLIRQAAPGAFEFHILGTKVPAHLQKYFNQTDFLFDGFVPDLEAHLAQMDIALMPSIFGQGMQQKIFESLCRGFPTVTNYRALAAYPYEGETHLLLAEDPPAFVEQLLRLQDRALRQRLAEAASARSAELFNLAALRERVAHVLNLAQKTSTQP